MNGYTKCIKNNQEIWRKIDHIESVDRLGGLGYLPPTMMERPIPVLYEGEQIEWFVGDNRPWIVELKGDIP